ncbi:MAG: filamentous hemagglutinin [Burkholderiales bacterium]|nr:MAG: filamentous hemagglutinin [Burkholderiales bacterium]
MNRQRHRLVFSQSLGGLVPAAESTRGRGKAASGAGSARGATVMLGALLLAAPVLGQVPEPRASNFVTAGQAGYRVNGNQAFVNQVGNKAILNWQQFNVGAGKTVQFGQVNDLVNNQLVQGASFTTLNRIWDMNPSVIAGSITQAPGQKANVILVNSNGIAFMGGSQVNLASFTASTLNMADKYILNGLLGDNLNPQFEKALDGTEARGFIQVFEGAKISAGSQGRVMLIAPTVVNAGTIDAPDGQVILAAGTRAFLRSDDSADLNVRGLLVEVDSSAETSKLGHATNTGAITSARGNVTMVGYAVNQMGLARATSSVVANGSVYLMAKDSSALQGSTRASTRGGQVVLAAGSLTEVQPELGDASTSVDGNSGQGLSEQSQIRVIGQRVFVAGGATIAAPSGDVSLVAVDNPATLIAGTSLDGVGATPSSTARVHVASGARIDVAGLNGVQVSAARNSVEVELRGDELKDSPINQTGVLRGEKAYVDIEQALANTDSLIARDSLLAYQARLERGAAERSTVGGTVTLRSEGETIVESGATFDLSGGSVNFSEAIAKTTVLSARGKLVDLADASAGTRYDGIVSRYTIDYGRWNQKEVIELPSASRFVQGYTEGKDAGSLNVQSMGAAYLQGSIVGRTVSGERQVASGQSPRGARLNIGTEAIGTDLKDHKLNQTVVIDRSRIALPQGFAMDSTLSDVLKQTLALDADLLGEGRVAELGVFTNQAAEVRAALRAPLGGSVRIAARDLTVKSDIYTGAGRISLASRNNANQPLKNTTLRVDDGVRLGAQGTFVNRLQGAPDGDGSLPRLDGGQIELSAEGVAGGGIVLARGVVSLGQGVTMDVSGGALLDQQGELTEGRGGSIGVAGYAVEGLAGATLSAYGLKEGGELRLTSEQVTIGSAGGAVPGVLALDPLFFTQGGFANYTVTGLRDLEVADNTNVEVRTTNRELVSDFLTRSTGTAMAALTSLQVLPDNVRQAASISLAAKQSGAGTGSLRIGQGARVAVEPGGDIALEARNTLDIQGTLQARGGAIKATLDRSTGFVGGSPDTNSLWLGNSAVLDASGVAQTYADARRLTQGTVRDGGSVTLQATTGYVVAEAGARINVSGAAPVRLDERNESGGIGRDVASDAGRVKVFAEEGLLFDATLTARGGAPGRRGGSLDIELAKNARLEGQAGFDSQARTLVLANSVAPQTAGLVPGGAIPLTGEVRATLGTDALESAGFDRMRFASRDGIALQDGLTLGDGHTLPMRELQLDAARIETLGSATLSADALRLGNYDTNNRTGTAGTTTGAGVLSAQGRLLELAGNLRLQGMARSELTGTEQVQLSGVTRDKLLPSGALAGSFEHTANIETSADLTLHAGVVNPGSFAQVSVKAAGRDVRLESVGSNPIAPLAALGSVRIEAQNITQAGRLVAPMGQIELVAQGDLVLAPGSITSVSAAPGQVLPLGQVRNGTDWVVNLNPKNVLDGQIKLETLPDKSVRLSGGSVRLQSNAQVNISGGGDLQAYEFSVGPGGSRDILGDANTYAVIPGYRSGFAPSDPQESTGRALGEAVYLTGVNGLADGTYTLLPSHYALLPGAIAVRLSNAVAVLPGQGYTRQDGIQVVAGVLTDSRTGAPRDASWRAVEVLTSDQVRARSEFTLSAASQFFSGERVRPQDAGLLSVVTQGMLELDARLVSSAGANGRGASVDISAPNLVVAGANASGIDPTATRVDVAQLNALGAESLLLGATRTRTGDGTTTLEVGSNALTLANDAQSALSAPEVMLAARETLTLRTGSVIDAQGAAGDAGTYSTVGNGAFVRAASTSANFERTGTPDRSAGTLLGGAGSVVRAARSITLDATRDNRFEGQALFRKGGVDVAGELAVGASRVSLGTPTAPVDGVTYSQAELDTLLGLDALTLTSYSSFDLYGNVQVGGVGTNGRPTLKNLTLQGAGLAGLANTGATAQVRAQRLTLANTAGASFTPAFTPGTGNLEVLADTLVLGQGDKKVDGFGQLNITANEVIAAGTGKTDALGQTTMATARLGGESGAHQTLNSGNGTLAVIQAVPSQPLAASTALGAGWTLNAQAVTFDTRADLASGQLTLNASGGDVTLGENAAINVAGRDVAFFNTTRGTWGGTVVLSSTTGDVNAAAGSCIDVSSGAGADAGTLVLNAARGRVTLHDNNVLGHARADADGQRGQGSRVRVDAGTLANASVINRALNTGGFDGERTLRARGGDLNVAAGDTVSAKRVTLSADAGSIQVAGTVSASGAEGGQVGLYAGQSVVLANGGRLEAAATAAGGDGGQVEIGAVNGGVDLRAGSQIDLAAGAGGEGGTLHLRAQRIGNDVAVTALDSAVSGARSITLEAVRAYNNINTLNATGASNGTTLSLATVNANDTAYAANHSAIKARLGKTGDPDFRVVSGVEVRSGGDLTLAQDWNLANSAAGGEAGVLTLLAQGHLNINNNLSDGFSSATPYSSGTTPATLLPDSVRGGRSWAYRLVAGADAGAANPMATGHSGDLTVAAGKLVRTGNGDIRMAAGQDIKLASNASAVYTAGKLSGPLTGFVEPLATQRAYFTQGGGNVEMSAGRDVAGAASAQIYSDWLFRQGRLDADGVSYPAAQGNPAWWVRFDQFRQGVGALGGGDVTVRAGGNVINLSASAPTQGRMASSVPDALALVKTGGGNVVVEAGTDVMGGQFYADNGDVRVTAGGQLGSGQTVLGGAVFPIFAVGDGQVRVRANGNLNVHTVLNPTLLVQSYGATDIFNIGAPAQRAQRRALFSTYTEDTAAHLTSLNGNVVLHNAAGADGVANLSSVYPAVLNSFEANNGGGYRDLLAYLPPSLSMTAFAGDVKLHESAGGGRVTLLPAARGQLELLAQGSVHLNASLVQSDNNPETVASVLRPTVDPTLVLAPDANVVHAAVPVHAGDRTTAKVYAVTGDVKGVSQALEFGSRRTELNLAKAVEVRAGRDVQDVNLVIQHANAGDRSVIEAGRDIGFAPGGQRTDEDGVRIAGPGRLQVSAQRDIDLGTSGGIVSRGDLDNANLDPVGANIEVLAGTSPAGLDALGALQRLSQRLATGSASDTDLWLARWLTGNNNLEAGSAPGAVAAVAALTPEMQRDRVRDFVFTALRETGRDANRAGSGYVGSFDRGYAALDLVFPGIAEKDASGNFSKYNGGINLFASRIKTERGGNIDILVPGGGMVVGLPNTPNDLINVGNNVLGVVVAAAGDIKVFTRDDMLVNQSRILTVGGGDVLLWSSEGDIDAGKGKKTASAVPPPIIKVDAQGNVTQELQGAASGSGIGALSTAGVTAGDVDLIAPKGTVNAGDAGIRAGNLNIAALVVLGADNISVSGTSAGTPVADTSAVSAASSGATSGGDDTGKVVAALNEAAAESAKAAQELAASLRPSVVRVDVLGFGE